MTIGLSLPANADDVVVSAPGDDRLHARAFAASQAEHAWKAAGTPLEERLDEYKRSSRCNDDPELDEPGIDQSCYIPPGIEITGPTCEDGPAIAPLWFRYRASVDSAWSTWEMLVGWSCPEHLLPPVDVDDLRVLRIAPPEVGVQPSGDMLVNKPAILFTAADAQAFDVDIEGFAVEIVAEPTAWEWAFDDGERLATDVPGAPYPSFDITHTFRTPMEASTVGLTTSWRGRYRVASDPLQKWRAIDGTAVTRSSSDPFDVIELRTRLTD
ncbi:hypothetical protein [Cellulomonas persica]|uniref:PKD domain-containing protein n=1 Tax=Cellulomonas persica TaxID=76861 RepID=A0A510UP88_9CELL|nr:hypothetical protein [Cellulomonas persica]GEK16472.1 hypothetical protein CPE01_02050 [Cellulomonas persica]